MTDHHPSSPKSPPVWHYYDSYGYEPHGETRAQRSLRRRFSVELSTEEHFRSSDTNFYGAYGYVRKNMDYTFHAHYRKERQWFHDSIIEDMLAGGQREEDSQQQEENEDTCPRCEQQPRLILTVGAQGAGKRYTIDFLIKNRRLLLRSYVVVDTDEIRRYLPEYASFIETCPERVEALTQKEADYIGETLARAAIQQGRIVIFDCSLRDPQWYMDFIDELRREIEGLKVGLIHITAPSRLVLERAAEKAKETGRTIPEETILEAWRRIPISLACIQYFVDDFFEIYNEDEPFLESASWDDFTAAFSTKESTHDKKIKRIKPLTRRLRRRFSTLRSSEENHRSDDLKFYGKYAHIRKTLDYGYHSNYTLERQMFQDAIVDHFMDGALVEDKNGEICTTPTEPWAVFTAGAMGAGKSHTMRILVAKGRFPLLAFVDVDPDAIRQFLPEFHLYVEANPEIAGELTRKEAGFVAEILALAGLQAGKNVLVDGSLRDSEWYEMYFGRLRKEFPVLRLAILHVTAPRDAVFRRAAERAIETGRIVPNKVLLESLEQVPISVAKLAPLVDYSAELNNAPDTLDVELVTPGETWESFCSQWIQACAWIPKKRSQDNLLRKLSAISATNGQIDGSLVDRL